MNQASTKKMTPGDDMHLTLLMAPHNLNLVTGQDRQHLLAFGRAAFEAGQKCQGCSVPPNGLHQIAEPSHSMSQYASKDDMLKAVMAENEQLRAQLAAAQQSVQPFGYVNTQTGQFFKDVELCRKNNEGHWRTVYTYPTPQGLEQFIEQAGDVHFQRCRLGSIKGPIRWDVSFGHHGIEVRGKTLQEAIAKALAAQAKQGERKP